MADLHSPEQTEIFLAVAEDISEIGCFSWDIGSNVLSWSDGLLRIYGIDRADFTGTLDGFFERLYPDDRPLVREAIGSALESGGRFRSAERILRPSGEIRWLESRGMLVVDDDGQPVRLVGVCRDITESRQHAEELQRQIADRRMAEEQLQQAQKLEAIGRLTGGVAHDFNNLLTVIVSNVELLENFPAGAIDTLDRERLLAIRGAGERAAQLTQQLLLYSRGSTRHPQPVDVNTAVNEAADFLGRTLGRHIEVQRDLDASAPVIAIDPTHLQQTLMNLGLNARDAMPDGGTLSIRTRVLHAPDHAEPLPLDSAGDVLVIDVNDTGRGVDDEIRLRMFDPFFTTKPDGTGTGLGLSVVYGIVTAAHGGIAVDSRPGGGTRIRLCFPLSESRPDECDASGPGAQSGEGHAVLVVEDEPAVLRVLTSALSTAGFRVIGFDDPLEACRRFAESPEVIGLVITDVSMPALSGPEMVESLRGILGRPDLPALYISGNDRNVLENTHGLAIGDGSFLQKPFRIGELLRLSTELMTDRRDRA